MHMPLQGIVICSVFLLLKFNQADKSCFEQSNDVHYLFLTDISYIKIPLLPLDCLDCQSAYQVEIQLIDEQPHANRTIERIKIFLKNFEIEDSSYICLRHTCPILVEHGSDSIGLNITSSLFSHVFLSLTYLNPSAICSIQTRFAIFSVNTSLTCTPEIYLHPRLHIQIISQLRIFDCRANSFETNIYRTSIQFTQLNVFSHHLQTTMKSSEKPCEYIIETINYLKNSSFIETNELSTMITISPFYNPWRKGIQTIGPCRTKIIPYREMEFAEDIVNYRNIYIEPGQTIRVQCKWKFSDDYLRTNFPSAGPIEGSEKYLTYIWYYQRYQPKYQISNHRTIILGNITEQMQGKYMCVGDDGNEKLEFEMTVHISNPPQVKNNSDTFYSIIISILLLLLFILFCLIWTLIIYFSFKKSSPVHSPLERPNALTIHHDVLLTIQHLSHEDAYQSFDYIDDQPTYPLPPWSWIKQIPHRFSTRHRNVNRQLSTNIPIVQSPSDMKLSPILTKLKDISDEKQPEMEILKISVPLLNQYPLIQSSSSIISFDSYIELEQFNAMTSVCMDNDALVADR